MPPTAHRPPTESIACRVDARLIPDVMLLVRAGTVRNKSDAVERGLRLLLSMNADTLSSARAREAGQNGGAMHGGQD